MGIYKFGIPLGGLDTEYEYRNIYTIENLGNTTRLKIAPKRDQVNILLNLAKTFVEPLGILYVLVVPRSGVNEQGRYQSPRAVNFSELEEFCYTFKGFIETDSRHHLWIVSTKTNNMLIYDRHNVIFAYGDIDNMENVLKEAGLTKGEVVYPCPHSHMYNPENDIYEEALLNYWDWRQHPLREEDDY